MSYEEYSKTVECYAQYPLGRLSQRDCWKLQNGLGLHVDTYIPHNWTKSISETTRSSFSVVWDEEMQQIAKAFNPAIDAMEAPYPSGVHESESLLEVRGNGGMEIMYNFLMANKEAIEANWKKYWPGRNISEYEKNLSED